MAQGEGLLTLDEIWASHFPDGESDEGDAPQAEASESESEVEEQIQDSDTPDVPAKLADLLNEEGDEVEGDGQAEAGPIDYSQEITLPDGETVTLRQLIDERLMRADYTRKTQELAEQRKAFEAEREQLKAAAELRDMLQEDPVGTVAELAHRLGLLDDYAYQQAVANKGADAKGLDDLLTPKKSVPSPEELEKLIEEKARALLEEWKKSDPAFEELEVRAAQNKVNQIFDYLEQVYSVELDMRDRNAILKQALKDNDEDLEKVFLRMQTRLNQLQRSRSNVKRASAPRSVGGDASAQVDVTNKPPASIDEAWERAKLLLAQKT